MGGSQAFYLSNCSINQHSGHWKSLRLQQSDWLFSVIHVKDNLVISIRTYLKSHLHRIVSRETKQCEVSHSNQIWPFYWIKKDKIRLRQPQTSEWMETGINTYAAYVRLANTAAYATGRPRPATVSVTSSL